MQSRDDLNRKIRKLVSMCTGLDPQWVSPANQSLDVAEPPQVWATVLVSVFGPVGKDEVKYTNGANNLVSEVVEGTRLCTASIQFFRVGANDLANRLKTRISMSNAVEYMRAADIGYVGFSEVQDISAVESEDWEERAQLTLTFHTSIIDEIDLETYGHWHIKLYRDEPAYTADIFVDEPSGATQDGITTEGGNVLTTESENPLIFE